MFILGRLAHLLLLYVGTAISGMAILVALHRTILFSGETILFYRGVLLAIVSALIVSAMLYALARRLRIDLATALGCVIASLSLNTCFLVLVPVTVDRSISVFILARIERHNGELTTGSLDVAFRKKYLGDMRQIERRVSEQSRSGNIQVDEHGRISVTARGKAFLRFSRVVAVTFGTDPRFVLTQGADAD